MTRYVVMAGNRWVTAVYEPSAGVQFTCCKEDASSWVTYERAVDAARAVMQFVDEPVFVHSVQEPLYPRSWK